MGCTKNTSQTLWVARCVLPGLALSQQGCVFSADLGLSIQGACSFRHSQLPLLCVDTQGTTSCLSTHLVPRILHTDPKDGMSQHNRT